MRVQLPRRCRICERTTPHDTAKYNIMSGTIDPTTVWTISLLLGLVVTLVVALLLWFVHREAKQIETPVAEIWEAGQRVANNTVHIPLLYRTAEVVTEILTTVQSIAQAASAIGTHAKSCPGCPECLWRNSGGL